MSSIRLYIASLTLALTSSFAEGAQPTSQETKPSEIQTQVTKAQDTENAPKQGPVSADPENWSLYEPTN